MKNSFERLLLSDVFVVVKMLWKFLFQNENIKRISKIVNLKKEKKNILYNSHICYIYLMFHYKIPWFYQDFKSENLWFLNMYSVHEAKILDLSLQIMLNPPRWGTQHLHNSEGFSFIVTQVEHFYYLEPKFINVF